MTFVSHLSPVASRSAALVILCLHQKMNQSITFTIIHRPHHHMHVPPILERPSKVSVAEMTGLSLWLLRVSASTLPQFPCLAEP